MLRTTTAAALMRAETESRASPFAMAPKPRSLMIVLLHAQQVRPNMQMIKGGSLDPLPYTTARQLPISLRLMLFLHQRRRKNASLGYSW